MENICEITFAFSFKMFNKIYYNWLSEKMCRYLFSISTHWRDTFSIMNLFNALAKIDFKRIFFDFRFVIIFSVNENPKHMQYCHHSFSQSATLHMLGEIEVKLSIEDAYLNKSFNSCIISTSNLKKYFCQLIILISQ